MSRQSTIRTMPKTRMRFLFMKESQRPVKCAPRSLQVKVNERQSGVKPGLFGSCGGDRCALRDHRLTRGFAAHRGLRLALALGQLLAVVVLDDTRHVGMGLAVGWQTLVLLHALR